MKGDNIMKITKEGNNYLISRNDGVTVILTCAEAGLLVNYIGKEGLRVQIEDRTALAELDWLDLSKYEGTFDEFVQEIFDDLEDEIDYGNSVSDDEIDERISDTAAFYGGLKKEV